MPRGVVPPGTYAKGARSPIVYVLLCPSCAGYAPTTDPSYSGALSGRCQGCGADSRELHRFQALILSAANGGCMCDSGHPQVTGDLPTLESANAVLTEVLTRPALHGFGPVPERIEVTYCTMFCGAACTCRLRFRRPDGSWSCTRDHVTEPCGDCDGCRQVAAENSRH